MPSVVGALRFWWRTLHAGLSPAELARREGALFGTGAGGDPGKKRPGARLHARVQRVSCSVIEAHKVLRTHAPNHVEASKHTDAAYLAYGIKESAKSTGGPVRGFDAGGSFELILHGLGPGGWSERERAELETALRLMGTCGGLGARSRRGIGSLTLTSLGTDAATAQAVGAVEDRLAQAGLEPGADDRTHRPLPNWTAWSPASGVWVVNTAQEDPTDTLGRLGAVYKNHRIEHRGPGEGERSAVRGGSSRAFLGLPAKIDKRDVPMPSKPHKMERRASPLLFHIDQPHADHPPSVVLTFLPARYLRPGATLLSHNAAEADDRMLAVGRATAEALAEALGGSVRRFCWEGRP